MEFVTSMTLSTKVLLANTLASFPLRLLELVLNSGCEKCQRALGLLQELGNFFMLSKVNFRLQTLDIQSLEIKSEPMF